MIYTQKASNMLEKISCKCKRCNCFSFESQLKRNMFKEYQVGQKLDKTQKSNLLYEFRERREYIGYKYGQFE